MKRGITPLELLKSGKATYRPDEVARIFDISIRTLYRRVSEGWIRPCSIRPMRFPREEVLRLYEPMEDEW